MITTVFSPGFDLAQYVRRVCRHWTGCLAWMRTIFPWASSHFQARQPWRKHALMKFEYKSGILPNFFYLQCQNLQKLQSLSYSWSTESECKQIPLSLLWFVLRPNGNFHTATRHRHGHASEKHVCGNRMIGFRGRIQNAEDWLVFSDSMRGYTVYNYVQLLSLWFFTQSLLFLCIAHYLSHQYVLLIHCTAAFCWLLLYTKISVLCLCADR